MNAKSMMVAALIVASAGMAENAAQNRSSQNDGHVAAAANRRMFAPDFQDKKRYSPDWMERKRYLPDAQNKKRFSPDMIRKRVTQLG